jgi:tetratricopeptide (TPR) repeat protein
MTWIAQLAIAASLAASQQQVYELNNKAESQLIAGDERSAHATLEQALASAETAFGPDHPATAMMARNLAFVSLRNGDTAKARHLAQRSVQILETRFGPRDVSLTPALNVLGEVLVEQGLLPQARELFERAIRIGPDAGPHYATALHNLGAVLELQGDARRAKRYYNLSASLK